MGSRKVIYLIVIFLLVISIVYIPGFVGEEDKHRVITEEEFQTKLENKDYDFSWCVFPFEVNLSSLTLVDVDFSNAIFEKDVNCTNLNCTDVNFSNATFEKNVYFNNITFNTTGDNYTSFIGAHFKGEVKFMGVSSKKGSIKFDNAIFEGDNNNFYNINAKGDVYFNNVIFKKSVGFHEFEFKQGIDFKGSIFENNFRFGQKGDTSITKGIASFQNVTFGGNTTFDNVSFKDSVQFNSADPEKDSKSERTVFKGYAYFEDVIFNGDADFDDVTFEGEVSFLNTTFKKDVSFKKGSQKKGTIFKDETDFSGVTFESNVSFKDAIFEDTVWFQSHGNDKKTIFGKENYLNDRRCTASFIGTEFHDTVVFDCIFYIEATFQSAKFNGNTYFIETVFNGSVNFKYAEFGGVSNFSDANFGGETNFNRAVFRDNVYFKNTDFGRIEEIKLGATFERILIFRPTSLYKIDMSDFQALEYTEIKADLTDAKFEDVYLKNVNFIDCKWPKDYKIYEETHMNDDLSYSDLEKIYRNIKISFQNYGDNEMAGYFLYREKEMKREGTLFFKDPFHWALIHLYWGTCGYGERFSFILFWSLSTMVGFALLFWILGIEINTRPYRVENNFYRFFSWEIDNRNIKGEMYRDFISGVEKLTFILCRYKFFNLAFSYLSRYRIIEFVSYIPHIFEKIWSFFSWIGIKDIAYCLLFSIASFSTLGTKYIKPKGNASRWLSALESLIGAFFIALFIYVFARKMLR